jgi:hypothetical protein
MPYCLRDVVFSHFFCAAKTLQVNIKPVFHSRILPPLAKNFATEKVHLFFRAVNERSNRS